MNDSIPPDHFIQGHDTDFGRNQINQGEYWQLNISGGPKNDSALECPWLAFGGTKFYESLR